MDDSDAKINQNECVPLSLEILFAQNSRTISCVNQRLISPVSEESQDSSLLPAVPDIYEIDLHSNFISKIPETFFRPFISLKVLNLGANELKHIPNLRGLTCLTELYLNNNKIESLHHLDFLPQLQILDLRANRIESVTGLQNNQNLQRYGTIVLFRSAHVNANLTWVHNNNMTLGFLCPAIVLPTFHCFLILRSSLFWVFSAILCTTRTKLKRHSRHTVPT
jgi:Leucine-rich repeat (LRR) protein